MDNSRRPFNRISIRQIQSLLTSISRIDRDVPRVNPDGIYSPETASAVSAFQAKYLGSGNGRVDFSTWQRLLSIGREAEEQLARSEPIFPFEERFKNGKLVKGDKSDAVALVRLMMRSIGITYPFFEDLGISEFFDDEMVLAIKDFQLIQGITASGEINKETWNRLALAYNRSLSKE